MSKSLIDIESLNPQQKEAVLTTEGPLLALAGAGSGKTRVITYRIAHLVLDMNISPSQIIAITFTNKAAQEMRARLASTLGALSKGMQISTFHSFCVRVLRSHAEALGYTSAFTVYDEDDVKRLMKEIYKNFDIDDKAWSVNSTRNRISDAKNNMISAAEYEATAGTLVTQITARVYSEYQARLKRANAMDFDDLLVNVVRLFEKREDILATYQERYRYIHVDEYQDTNNAQYRITNMLAKRYRNLMVVGDDDQSIYSWRGADISNILDFERDYPEAAVVKLEQNYRSTQTILDAANAVISKNKGRKSKSLFTEKGAGAKISLYYASTDIDEARYVAGEIEKKVAKEEIVYGEVAVFYRTNAQSRVFEDAFLRAGIPYRLIGGAKFFERAEIRDVMSYLKATVNSADDMSYKRIINTPRRKIGKATIDVVSSYAYTNSIPFSEAIEFAIGSPELKSAASTSLAAFLAIMQDLKRFEGGLTKVVAAIIDRSGLLAALEKEHTEESLARAENIKEFLNVVAEFEHDANDPTLPEFVEWLSLRTDLDSVNATDDSVVLMTVHTSKGLEFPVVFVAGLEEGIFPHVNSMFEAEDLEEERRLAYVAITRAKSQLYLLHAASRGLFGKQSSNPASRFIGEIPEELIERIGVGSRGFEGFGNEKRGDRHGTSSYGAGSRGSYSTGFGYGGYDAERDADMGRRVGAVPRASLAQNKSREDDFAAGDRVSHKTFGMGTVEKIDGSAVFILFDRTREVKKLVLGYAPLVKMK